MKRQYFYSDEKIWRRLQKSCMMMNIWMLTTRLKMRSTVCKLYFTHIYCNNTQVFDCITVDYTQRRYITTCVCGRFCNEKVSEHSACWEVVQVRKIHNTAAYQQHTETQRHGSQTFSSLLSMISETVLESLPTERHQSTAVGFNVSYGSSVSGSTSVCIIIIIIQHQ